jgi:hypothetical protein
VQLVQTTCLEHHMLQKWYMYVVEMSGQSACSAVIRYSVDEIELRLLGLMIMQGISLQVHPFGLWVVAESYSGKNIAGRRMCKTAPLQYAKMYDSDSLHACHG